MKHVIVGNGPAGVIAAETLRKEDPASDIVLIGDEPHPPYSRMALPYLLEGQIDERGTYLRKAPDHFKRLGIELKTARVAAVDTTARRVSLEDGGTLDYDRLLIATGSRPNPPPVPGGDSPGVFPCWTLADARRIMQRAKRGARVVQMGAGFIGCILLDPLVARGVALTLVEMGNRLVPRMMGETAGNLIRRWVERQGIKVYTSTRVERIEAKSGTPTLEVSLCDGSRLEADLVINATGVRPNIEFLEGSGVKTDVGVWVDETMQTSVPGVYAAGDVSQAVEFGTGQRVVNAIQPSAADEARIAALNMAGKRATLSGSLAMNVLDTMGLVATSYGRWMGVPGGEGAELTDAERFHHLRLEFHDDVLVGANCLGLTEHVGVIRGLIQSRTPLGPWKDRLLKNPTRLMEAYLARAQGVAS